MDYQADGFHSESSYTRCGTVELNGNLLLNNNWNNNFGVANLNLFNNNRVMLWFEKRENQIIL